MEGGDGARPGFASSSFCGVGVLSCRVSLGLQAQVHPNETLAMEQMMKSAWQSISLKDIILHSTLLACIDGVEN